MEITFIGHSCFKIKGKELTLVIDPYDPKIGYKLPKLEADVVLSSHNHFDHANITAVSNTRITINSPGEYEVSGVFVEALPTFHDENNGEKRGENIIYSITIDGFTLLHLGDLGHQLPESTLEKIGEVDVLMIPVGGEYTIDAEAATKVISAIEPRVVVPMHYNTPDLSGVSGLAELSKFLEEMGVDKNYKKMDKLKVSSRSELTEEDTEVIVLTPNH